VKSRSGAEGGIESKLSLSLGALAAMAIAAAVIGWIAFGRIGSATDRITTDSLPQISLALRIGEQSARITSGAPIIVASSSQDERLAARTAVDQDIAALLQLVQQWQASKLPGEPGAPQQLDALALELANGIQELDVATRLRLEIAADRSAKSATLRQVHDAFLEDLEPLLDNLVFELAMAAERGRAAADAAATTALDALMTLRAEGNLALGILSEAANEPQQAALTPLMERLESANGQMARALQKLPRQPDYEPLRESVQRLLLQGAAGDSILDLRGKELRQLALARAELEASRGRSAELRQRVERLVVEAEQESQAAAATAGRTIASGKGWFLLISAASLLGALLVLAGYVRPRIIRPIGEITDTMSLLADGKADIDIPGRERDDELGRMAQALEVFRDITVKIQKTNLLEVEAARHRLFDAIESISEAFSLFDAQDRLVVFNRMFLSMVHPEIREHIKPGIPFETISRLSVEKGVFPEAIGREAEWLKARLEKHRSPEDPQILSRSDGTWIMISERRTNEGGYVAVYSDITELKERENELADQTETLRKLSTQLSKYLSPQIYQSIFTGKQTAHVASQRKKLTVFFSDIAGFTEASDRMESEDLTLLLNEYLTEMSKIGLAYGATIDKYVGDAIMMFFGDPVSRGLKEDAVACVRMAIDMRKRLKELASIWDSRGFSEHLITRTGIHTGYCTVGNFGSEDRMDYTIIGGAVNLASRLEHNAQPGTILISHDTYSLVHSEIHCIEHETVKMKGLAYPVKTWVVVDTHAALGSQAGHVFKQSTHMLLDANLDAMDPKEREEAARTLRGLLGRLDKPS
jgi:adenylate cyclase